MLARVFASTLVVASFASCAHLGDLSPESAADAVVEGCRALLENTAVDAPSERIQRARLVCAYVDAE